MINNRREHNPDWIERQKPCDICGEPIGDEAMYTEAQKRYHMRCVARPPKMPQDCAEIPDMLR